ncbi:hypothetical protein GUJ93_ZPchr1933g22904 [Zizania palustris]|uniref:BHLH domain-containing protein n=1 Tax=Zizania palustris TaxID=103762 RepID=A0A8J5VET9_ZIZPA|nr:hypothetical protein GUJ93_ZPchr1933g22904 [Zizania palustris]
MQMRANVKITGKALMLDEIINYVQSLQRQVEFLSMKLATMNPQLELERHYLPSKDNQTLHPLVLASSVLLAENTLHTHTAPSSLPLPLIGQGIGQEIGQAKWIAARITP